MDGIGTGSMKQPFNGLRESEFHAPFPGISPLVKMHSRKAKHPAPYHLKQNV